MHAIITQCTEKRNDGCNEKCVCFECVGTFKCQPIGVLWGLVNWLLWYVGQKANIEIGLW